MPGPSASAEYVCMRRLLILIVLLVIVGPASASVGTTYYVSTTGADTNPGTASAPWRTVSRVNHASLAPGDNVLFAGGEQFTDSTLTPPSSGTSSAPIRFGSYGTGRAVLHAGPGTDVYLPSGSHDFVFDNLDLTGSGILLSSAGSGTGVYNVTIKNSYFHDTPQSAINDAIHADHNWTITANTFRHIGDSAIFVWGSDVSITGSVIADTGWNSAIAWGKHGIYDKGADSIIAFNDFSANAGGQAISLRAHGARVYGNTVHDTGYGIGFFDYDTTAMPQGSNFVYNNRFWNITGWGFYYSNQSDPQGNPPSINFVIASNTFSMANASEAVNVSEVPSVASVTLANNIFTGSYGSAYRGCPTCKEFNNNWYGGGYNIPKGLGDSYVAPSLSAAPSLAPRSTSPGIDAGTASSTGLGYVAACDGGTMRYCGLSPDMGAVEYLSMSSGTVADTTPPAAPASPLFTSDAMDGGTLSWSASTDNTGVTGYRVFLGLTRQVGTTTNLSYALTGLGCGTSYSVGIAAFDAAGNVSPTTSLPIQTRDCAASSLSTFGHVAVPGAQSSGLVADAKRVYPFTLSESGSVTQLVAWVGGGSNGGSGTQTVEGVLYADAGGAPGALLTASAPVTLSFSDAKGWRSLQLPSAVILGAGTYWLGLLAGQGNAATYGYDASGIKVSNSNSFTSGPSNPFGSGTSSTETLAVYAVYEPTASTPTSTSTPPPPSAGDTTPPAVQFSNLGDGAVVSSPFTVRVSAQDPSGIADLSITLDGSSICSTNSASISCVVATRGWHVIKATANDLAGNVGSVQVRVRFAK
jgi:hypothetical protein